MTVTMHLICPIETGPGGIENRLTAAWSGRSINRSEALIEMRLAREEHYIYSSNRKKKKNKSNNLGCTILCLSFSRSFSAACIQIDSEDSQSVKEEAPIRNDHGHPMVRLATSFTADRETQKNGLACSWNALCDCCNATTPTSDSIDLFIVLFRTFHVGPLQQ